MNLAGYIFGRAAAESGQAAGREGHNLYRGESTWDVRIGKRQQDAYDKIRLFWGAKSCGYLRRPSGLCK